MAYDYLGLVNDVNRRLNEVELTTANFASTTGYYSFAKDAVNAAIRHIQQEEYGWPWNHVEETEVLVPGIVRYGFPYDSKIIDMNTFRIKRDDALNTTTKKLRVISYEEYLTKYADQEYNSNTNIRTVPTHVARTPSREFMLYPSPDKAYELIYEYYRTGFDLENATDVCNLPEQYRYVIVDGAMHYVYQFRRDTQASQLAMQKFEQGIKYLRSLHINRTDYLGDTRVGF